MKKIVNTRYHKFEVEEIHSMYVPGFVFRAVKSARANYTSFMFDFVTGHFKDFQGTECSLDFPGDYDVLDAEDTWPVITYNPDADALNKEILYPGETYGDSYVYVFDVTDVDVSVHWARIIKSKRK